MSCCWSLTHVDVGREEIEEIKEDSTKIGRQKEREMAREAGLRRPQSTARSTGGGTSRLGSRPVPPPIDRAVDRGLLRPASRTISRSLCLPIFVLSSSICSISSLPTSTWVRDQQHNSKSRFEIKDQKELRLCSTAVLFSHSVAPLALHCSFQSVENPHQIWISFGLDNSLSLFFFLNFEITCGDEICYN